MLLSIFFFHGVILGVQALQIDTSSTDSICKAAATVASGLMSYYDGSGSFTGDYYWWEYSQLFHALLDYTYKCDDDQFEYQIHQGIVSQLGEDNDFRPASQQQNIGNDDQTFWGLLLLNAHKRGLEDPKSDLTWLQAAENVFNLVHERWDPDTCGGGVRWQILTDHSGYNYKNSITNGNLFLMASKLYSDTNDESYYKVAQKIWGWINDVGFIKENDDGILKVIDGANVDDNCEVYSEGEWSYNYGTYLGGLSTLYGTALKSNSSSLSQWLNATRELIVGVETFFNDDDIMYERTCQLTNTCNEDERCFKSILTRNIAELLQTVTSISDNVQDLLELSAKGAAQSCSGGDDGVTCGLNWYEDGWDGKYGIGEQMNALAVLVSLVH